MMFTIPVFDKYMAEFRLQFLPSGSSILVLHMSTQRRHRPRPGDTLIGCDAYQVLYGMHQAQPFHLLEGGQARIIVV
jgi:hypothetical protein